MNTAVVLRSLLLAAFVAAAAPAWADIGPNEAASVAQRVSGGGRVLSVDRSGDGRRVVWRVKVVTPRGEVRVIHVDAATGQAF